jgi:hypothetical protein
MLEEDFGPPTTMFLALVSCLKYVEEPTPEQWDPIPPPEESKDEVQNQNDLLNCWLIVRLNLQSLSFLLSD